MFIITNGLKVVELGLVDEGGLDDLRPSLPFLGVTGDGVDDLLVKAHLSSQDGA